MRKLALFGLMALIAAVAVLLYFRWQHDGHDQTFQLAKVERGPIVSRVSSSGTLNAVITVQVGTQVSGQIKELPADFNSEVKKDQVIARIDPENFLARIRQAEAELAVSQANVLIQRASVEKARADVANAHSAQAAARAQTQKARVAVANAKRDLERKMGLLQTSAISKSQFDEAQSIYDQAVAMLSAAEADERAQGSIILSREAQLKMAEAQVAHAEAQVKQREAALNQSQVDLEHTIIRSPVEGVVIERSVDIGQTVAASLQAPRLFTIAQDLRKMQVNTNVDEADIGRIYDGQPVAFTVDAFPGQEFSGQVLQIRKAAQTVQNVVTYTVVVSADNPDLKLLPGMTANALIVVAKRDQALKVPNSALRFWPPGEEKKLQTGSEADPPAAGDLSPEERLKRLTAALQLTEEQQARIKAMAAEIRAKIAALRSGEADPEKIRTEFRRLLAQSQSSILTILMPAQREKYLQIIASRTTNPARPGNVWVLDKQGRPKKVEVVTGINDGAFTEILRGDITPGDQVIVGLARSSTSPGGTRGFGL
ncbi:MAG: efflux RND transporter periplasmic adaptor subunit [Pseudomonadota bacterium]